VQWTSRILQHYNCEGGFALIGRQGALCGNVNFANGRFWATEHAVVVRTKRRLVTRWLGEILRCLNLNQYATASAQPGLSVEVIVNKFLPLPTLSEQQHMVDCLDRELPRIDKQIDLSTLGNLLKEQRKASTTRPSPARIDLSNTNPRHAADTGGKRMALCFKKADFQNGVFIPY